jgi:hypothetical protein
MRSRVSSALATQNPLIRPLATGKRVISPEASPTIGPDESPTDLTGRCRGGKMRAHRKFAFVCRVLEK